MYSSLFQTSFYRLRLIVPKRIALMTVHLFSSIKQFKWQPMRIHCELQHRLNFNQKKERKHCHTLAKLYVHIVVYISIKMMNYYYSYILIHYYTVFVNIQCILYTKHTHTHTIWLYDWSCTSLDRIEWEG